METETLFSEKQRFRQWWLWFILATSNLFCFYGIFRQIKLKQQFGDKPMGNG